MGSTSGFLTLRRLDSMFKNDRGQVSGEIIIILLLVAIFFLSVLTYAKVS